MMMLISYDVSTPSEGGKRRLQVLNALNDQALHEDVYAHRDEQGKAKRYSNVGHQITY